MNKIIRWAGGLACIVLAASCNDKLEIAAPYKNITVVYGLLDMTDSAHYIRIEKAFMDGNQSAVDMAKVPDSSFYNALTVSMKEFNAGGTLINTYALSRVNLDNEGYAKDTGAFFSTPNYAYKFKGLLNSGNTYRLMIYNTATGVMDSAETNVIDSNTASFGLTEWKLAAQTISFAREYTFDGDKLYQKTYTVNVPKNASVFQLYLRFNWVDSNIATHTSVAHSADFSTFYASGSNTLTVTNRDIYDFLRSTLGVPSDANQYRYFDSCDMILYAAGSEYKRYQELNQNTGGLTANEIKQQYTNIKGENVMGLFSTRAHVQKLQVPFSDDTKDSVAINRRTADLNIRFR
ncbi:hypothetical protein [Rurimicrobium arvi]|uniref:DUF4270 domain-containing protein n=1 Tax=Rurimicrobium arvi TaxID=2049916 RepID=A0ABP8N043_9BACT